MKIIPSFFLATTAFSLLGWVYVIGIQYFMDYSILTSPLTHWSRYPRVDDFGLMCFIASFTSFFLFLVTNGTRIEWI